MNYAIKYLATMAGFYTNLTGGPKTPRQAIRTAAGLERGKGLLRSYESSEKTQAVQQGRGEISYDFLWASLGVSR